MLYIVATPIGNIQDTSLRAAKTIAAADFLLVEDTRTFATFYQKIQRLFDLTPREPQQIIHLHKENEFELLPRILTLLQSQKLVALVSESGLPLISDPGSLLLKHVIKHHLPYTVVPGATAFVNALVLSGLSTRHSLFLGFLPKKPSQSRRLFNQLKRIGNNLQGMTVVFYESPHRINAALTLIDKIFPDAIICFCREMTKKFEQVIRGKARELIKQKFRGEITVVLELNLDS